MTGAGRARRTWWGRAGYMADVYNIAQAAVVPRPTVSVVILRVHRSWPGGTLSSRGPAR